MTTDKLIGAGFLIFVLVFVSRDFEVGSNDRSQPSVPYGASLFYMIMEKIADRFP